MAKAFIDDINLTSIANAIRNQNGTTTTYFPSEMASAINSLPVLDTSDATATSDDIIYSKIAYADGLKITGSLIVQKYYTSSDDPISTLGNDGDIYLKVGV